ncbi:TetR/AcrR family transcriptional regulator [Streptomyces erythrochromogenes]|uniref:TetR/AcrR family transcriptional regulator n=1 Tax=Streptomyces erythrochromogenes TaxID=285574 RepID=UPI003F4E34E5
MQRRVAVVARTVKRPEERRAEIVAAARRLFESRGYDDVTMNEVVADLAVAKGTVYHYFRSKEELLEAVVTDIVKQATERMGQVVEAAGGGPVERLAALVSAGRVAGENEQVLGHLHRSQNAGMHTRLLAVAIELQAPLYAQVLREGTAAGVFRVDHPLEAAEFLLSATQFLTDEGIAPWSPETLTRRARALPALAEQLLGAPEGSLAFLLTPAHATD